VRVESRQTDRKGGEKATGWQMQDTTENRLTTKIGRVTVALARRAE
jgi:hypothetical protein